MSGQVVENVIIEIQLLILTEDLLKLDIQSQSRTICVIKPTVLTFEIVRMKDYYIYKRKFGQNYLN